MISFIEHEVSGIHGGHGTEFSFSEFLIEGYLLQMRAYGTATNIFTFVWK
jgi:hypothetical protein